MARKKIDKHQLSFLGVEEGTPLFSNSCQRDKSVPFIPRPQDGIRFIPGFEPTFAELASAAQAKRFTKSQAATNLHLFDKESPDGS